MDEWEPDGQEASEQDLGQGLGQGQDVDAESIDAGQQVEAEQGLEEDREREIYERVTARRAETPDQGIGL